VIGEPPSVAGGSQAISQHLGPTSSTSGALAGAPGFSKMF